MTRQQKRSYARAVEKMQGNLDSLKPEVKLALFGLLVLNKMKEYDWWEDEHYWELSELGLKCGCFIDRMPTEEEAENSEYWDGEGTFRFMTPWVNEELKAVPAVLPDVIPLPEK